MSKQEVTIYVDAEGEFNYAILEHEGIEYGTADARQAIPNSDSVMIFIKKSGVNTPTNIQFHKHQKESLEYLMQHARYKKLELELECAVYTDFLTQFSFKGEALKAIKF